VGAGAGLEHAAGAVVRFEALTYNRLEELRRVFMEPLKGLCVGETPVAH
jgi:hypothetical protein